MKGQSVVGMALVALIALVPSSIGDTLHIDANRLVTDGNEEGPASCWGIAPAIRRCVADGEGRRPWDAGWPWYEMTLSGTGVVRLDVNGANGWFKARCHFVAGIQTACQSWGDSLFGVTLADYHMHGETNAAAGTWSVAVYSGPNWHLDPE